MTTATLLSPRRQAAEQVKALRTFQDGDFVFTHADDGKRIAFDIFRFEGGRIAQRWTNAQDKPASPNPSGHTMTDGPTEPTDLGQTTANKALVRAFVEDILVSGRLERLAGYFDGDDYVQHNPQIGDGLTGLGAALAAMANAGITMKYDRIERLLGEGNFVLVASEGQFAGRRVSFYDLFRVKGGKIAEHWDTIAPL